MLNPFPVLLAFGLAAPLIVRLIVGFIFLEFGWSKLTKERKAKAALFDEIGLRPGAYYAVGIGAIELIIGLLLIVGLFLQITALAGALVSCAAYLLAKKHPAQFENKPRFFCLLFFISLSLLFSGAGFFAFDLPL